MIVVKQTDSFIWVQRVTGPMQDAGLRDAPFRKTRRILGRDI